MVQLKTLLTHFVETIAFTPIDYAIKLFSGRDVFVSYGREDGTKYAKAVNRELINRGYTTLIDILGTESGETTPAGFLRKIRRCSMFVLIASYAACESSEVAKEIAEFKKNQRKQDRFVPIVFEDSLPMIIADSRPNDGRTRLVWQEINGIHLESETNEVAKGKVSDNVIDRIQLATDFSKQNTRQAATLSVLIVSGILFFAIAIGAGFYARIQSLRVREATASLESITTQVANLQTDKNKLEGDVGKLQIDISKAVEERTRAEGDAEKQKKLAKDAAQLRDVARAEADKQQAIASARQLANESQSVLKNNPDRLPASVLLASNSMQQFLSLNTAPIDSDLALRESLSILPSLERYLRKTTNPELAPVLSPDGRYVAIMSPSRIELLSTLTTRKLTLPIKAEDSDFRPTVNPFGNFEVSLLFSRNGEYVAATYHKQKAGLVTSIWNTSKGEPISEFDNRRFSGSASNKGCLVEFSPDGKYVAIEGPQSTEDKGLGVKDLVQIYETATKKKVSTLLINDQPRHLHERGYEYSHVITFSSDDNYNYVAAGSSDGVRTWEWRKSDGTPKTFNAADGVHVVEFDKSGKFLVTGSSYNGGLKTFLMPAKEGQKSLETAVSPFMPAGSIGAIEFSDNKKYMAVVTGTFVTIWDVSTETSREIQRINHPDAITAVAFSPDSKFFATASYDRTSRVWEIITGREVTRMVHNEDVRDVAYVPGRASLVSSSTDEVKMWSSASSLFVANIDTAKDHEYYGQYHRLDKVALSPDARYLATAEFGGGQNVRLWDLSSRTSVKSIETSWEVASIKFLKNGDLVIVGGEEDESDTYITVYEPGKPTQIPKPISTLESSSEPKALLVNPGDSSNAIELPIFTYESTVVSLSEDGALLATANESSVRIWSNWRIEKNTDKPLATINTRNPVLTMTLSKSGKYLATLDTTFSVDIWDWTKGNAKSIARMSVEKVKNEMTEVLESFGMYEHPPLIFSPDENYIVATGLTDTQVFDWRARRSVARYEAQAVFDPTGSFLATYGGDAGIQFWEDWNTKKPREIARLTQKEATHLGFSATQPYVAVASGNWAQVWLWRPNDLLSKACTQLKTYLETKESTKMIDEGRFRKVCGSIAQK